MNIADDFSDAGTFGGSLRNREAVADASEPGDIEQHNLENELVAADGLGEHFHLTSAMVRARAVKKFLNGAGAPTMSGEPRLAAKTTLWFVKLAREVVFELKCGGGSSVCILVSGHAPWVAQVSQDGCVRSRTRLGPSADANMQFSHSRSESLRVGHAKRVSPPCVSP